MTIQEFLCKATTIEESLKMCTRQLGPTTYAKPRALRRVLSYQPQAAFVEYSNREEVEPSRPVHESPQSHT